MSKNRWATALAFAAALPAAAFADETRERVLERKVAELERRLSEVETGRGGYFTAASDLEARVSELERASLDNKGGMNVLWKNGLKSESDDKAFTFQMSGRIQNDWAFWDADSDIESALDEEINGGTEFRRVRLGAQGTLYGNVKWKSEIDFADSDVEFADVYMELAGCSFGNIRIGHFDEPFGLDRLTSSRFITFMERNLVAEAFAPQRNTGIMLHGNAAEKMLTYQVGMFRDADGAGNDVDNASVGEYNLTGRLAARPIVEDDGATYLHLGVAASYRDFSDDEARFRARPQVHIGPRFVDTGTIERAEDGTLLGLEAAFVTGPFKVQAEYATISGNGGDGVDDFDFDSFGIEAAYWLTGEGYTYDTGKAAFDRPKVKKNFGDGDALGAWQVALGFDTIDLNDASYEGGEMDTIRLGVSWWLNPHTRISMNVVDIDVDDPTNEDARALEFRFQVDF